MKQKLCEVIMLLLIFLVIVPIFRLTTLIYRRSRLNTLKMIYEDYITGKPLKSKSGKPISIYEYQFEISNLLELCGIGDFSFSAQINHAVITNTTRAFARALGNVNLNIKRSLFPNTYLRYLADFPLALSRRVGLTPSKSLALVLYLVYVGIGYVDTAAAVHKIIEIVA